MEKVETLNLPITLSELKRTLVFLAISIVAFFVPFSLGHSQWVVGTIVNASLFLTAIFLPKKFYIPIAILPSLGLIARGIVFGPFTYFLVYFLPFILIANILLILVFKKLFKLGALGVIFSAGVKFLFLFLLANIYFNLHVVPNLFLKTMGLFQLYTALVGGVVAYIIYIAYAKFFSRS